jgi:hypothetical protein
MRAEPDRQTAGNAPRRVHLIDLVLAVIFCGLVVAAFASPHGIRESNFTFMAASAVGISWYFVRHARSRPTCEECGVRFYPTQPAGQPAHCPHCGEPLAAVRKTSMRRGFVLVLIAVMTAVCLLATFTFALDPMRDIRPFERSRLAALLMAAASALLATLATAWLIAARPRSIQPGVRICEGCGGIIPEKPPAPSICPNCRSRKLTHRELKEEQTRSNRFVILFFWILAVFGIAGIVYFFRVSKPGMGPSLLLFALPALVLLFFAWKLIPFLINSRKLQSVLGEEAALAKARACAGEDGNVVRVGPTTIWYSGPDDPVPILQDEILASHRRLEDLLGETAIADPPLTILCFHDQAALLNLYKSLYPKLELTAYLGVYLQRPWNIMALCTGTVAGRLDDARSSLGSLYCLVLLEQSVGQLSASWLQAGLVASLSAEHNRGDLLGLNRRMIAALREQLGWSENLFTASGNQVIKLLLRTKDRRRVRKSELFGDQAWSIVEYLAGEQAPDAQKTAFRAFVKDKRASAQQEQTFFQHFGFGFGSLLDSWRQWVESQGYGYGEPPSTRIRDALQNRVLPVIQDLHAPRADRIQAIRDWRKAGVPIGAATLIDLLRNPGDIPKDEIIWSLSGVSGMSWGDEPDRWQTWLNELPSYEARAVTEHVGPR